jgi:hypothetical protein
LHVGTLLAREPGDLGVALLDGERGRTGKAEAERP